MSIEWNRVTGLSQIVAIILGVLIFGIGFWLGMLYCESGPDHEHGTPAVQEGTPVINDVTFRCDAGKTVRAIFKQNSAQLLLSDGRNLEVPHAISADGGRYANDDESFVFWTKGTGAFITEGIGAKSSTTYQNCVEVPQPN
jgi:membrane-bound inhibitor of C-type lysozyme